MGYLSEVYFTRFKRVLVHVCRARPRNPPIRLHTRLRFPDRRGRPRRRDLQPIFQQHLHPRHLFVLLHLPRPSRPPPSDALSTSPFSSMMRPHRLPPPQPPPSAASLRPLLVPAALPNPLLRVRPRRHSPSYSPFSASASPPERTSTPARKNLPDSLPSLPTTRATFLAYGLSSTLKR